MDINKIKELREETGAGILEAKKALTAADGDYDKARDALMKEVSKKAAKKQERTAADGLVYAYIHAGGKIGSLVMVACETDFVGKTDDFKKLCHDIAMQVCCEECEEIEELLKSEYIKDSSKTIQDLINETTAKVGEKIEIKKFTKYTIGE